MEVSCTDLTLLQQRGTDVKIDSNGIIGSQRLWQSLIGLTERVNTLSQLIELKMEWQTVHRVEMRPKKNIQAVVFVLHCRDVLGVDECAVK